jgi:predicted amidohydrolase YtcJ
MRERIFANAEVLTLDPAVPRATAVVAVGDRIGFVGDLAGARAYVHAGAEAIDLGGAVVVPGLIEAHNHMIGFGLGLAEIDARFPTVASIADLTAAIGARAAATPAGHWVTARGYDDNKLTERRHPTRQDLDAVAPQHPVLVVNGSGHMSVANSLALRMAGVTGGSVAPQGGQIVLDEAGEPTGLLQEAAQELVRRLIPKPTVADLVAALHRCGERYLAAGITSSHTAGLNSAEELTAHQLAVEEGALPVRTYAMIGAPLLPHAIDLGLRTGLGDHRLRIGPAKFFSDGSLIGRTAAVTERTGSGKPYVPAEALTPHEALRLYTVAGASAAFEETDKGSVTVGKLADLTVLARDPAAVPPDEIGRIPVLATIIGGETAYEA